MKTLFVLYLILSLNLLGSVEDKFENYFDSEVEFQLLEEYSNIFSDIAPEKFYRIETEEYLEFVGVYPKGSWNEIYGRIGEIIEGTRDNQRNKSNFTGNKQKAVILREDNKVYLKFLKKK